MELYNGGIDDVKRGIEGDEGGVVTSLCLEF